MTYIYSIKLIIIQKIEIMKTFKLGILALVLGLFTLTSCEKEELESDDVPTTLSSGSSTSEPVDTVAFVDSLWNVWVTNGGARLYNGGMGDINFLVSSSGELDSLTFGNDFINDWYVEDGSFEYLGEGKFVFKYDQYRLSAFESFIDTVILSREPLYPDYIDVRWKNFTTLVPKSYFYQYVD